MGSGQSIQATAVGVNSIPMAQAKFTCQRCGRQVTKRDTATRKRRICGDCQTTDKWYVNKVSNGG